MSKNLAVKSFRLKNFKAMRDSGVVKFTPLTVLIGDNGSGKSSLVEGLETYLAIVMRGLDTTMGFWRGFEHIVNSSAAILEDRDERNEAAPSIEFDLRGSLAGRAYRTTMTIASGPSIQQSLHCSRVRAFWHPQMVERDQAGHFEILHGHSQPVIVAPGLSIIAPWIFITDDPSANALLADGCNKVLIIWDLYPSLKRDEAPCRHNDKEIILESLSNAGVSSKDVELICIQAELETWLVADYRAVRDVIRTWTPRARVGRRQRSLESNDPKGILDRLFREHAKQPYQPHNQAELRAKALPNPNQLRKVDSFRRFETRLTN